MVESVIQQIGAVLTVLITILALWLGRRPERAVAIASAIAFVVSPLVQNWKDFLNPQWGVATVDAAFFGFLTVVLLRYDRRWLLAGWSCSALTVLAHLGKLMDITLLARGYIGGLYVLYFAFLAAQAYGVWEARRPTAPNGTMTSS